MRVVISQQVMDVDLPNGMAPETVAAWVLAQAQGHYPHLVVNRRVLALVLATAPDHTTFIQSQEKNGLRVLTRAQAQELVEG